MTAPDPSEHPTSQWQCFLRNLGHWRGSFTRYDASGEMVDDTPSLVTLDGAEDNAVVKQQVFKYPPDAPPPEPIALEYRTLGRNILFFEDGSFSFGSGQFSPVAEFGAEQGFMLGDRRLRLVQLFASGKFSGATLIREFREGSEAIERPPLTPEQLVGDWEGTVTTMFPDLRPPDRATSCLSIRLDGDVLTQRLQTSQMQLASTGQVRGNVIEFESGRRPRRLLLLPDGASCNVSLEIPRQRMFFLEAGWLPQPDLRIRLMRTYDGSGQWRSSTQIVERKVG